MHTEILKTSGLRYAPAHLLLAFMSHPRLLLRHRLWFSRSGIEPTFCNYNKLPGDGRIYYQPKDHILNTGLLGTASELNILSLRKISLCDHDLDNILHLYSVPHFTKPIHLLYLIWPDAPQQHGELGKVCIVLILQMRKPEAQRCQANYPKAHSYLAAEPGQVSALLTPRWVFLTLTHAAFFPDA